MTWKTLLLLLVIIPVGLYLRHVTYWRVHGRNIIAEDIEELRSHFHRWQQKRAKRKAEQKKYGHLNK